MSEEKSPRFKNFGGHTSGQASTDREQYTTQNIVEMASSFAPEQLPMPRGWDRSLWTPVVPGPIEAFISFQRHTGQSQSAEKKQKQSKAMSLTWIIRLNHFLSQFGPVKTVAVVMDTILGQIWDELCHQTCLLLFLDKHVTLATLLSLHNHFSLIFLTSVIFPKKTVFLITTMHLVSCSGLPVSFARSWTLFSPPRYQLGST